MVGVREGESEGEILICERLKAWVLGPLGAADQKRKTESGMKKKRKKNRKKKQKKKKQKKKPYRPLHQRKWVITEDQDFCFPFPFYKREKKR